MASGRASASLPVDLRGIQEVEIGGGDGEGVAVSLGDRGREALHPLPHEATAAGDPEPFHGRVNSGTSAPGRKTGRGR